MKIIVDALCGSSGDIKYNVMSFLILITLITLIMYFFIQKKEKHDFLILVLCGALSIGLLSIIRIMYTDINREYYFQIVLAILSGLVGGAFVLVSLNHQTKMQEKNMDISEKKEKINELKKDRPYLYMKYNSDGGSSECEVKSCGGKRNKVVTFELENVGNGRAFDIVCLDKNNINIFENAEVLNIDKSIISKKIKIDYDRDIKRHVDFIFNFKDIMDNEYSQEFSLIMQYDSLGHGGIILEKQQPKLNGK